MSLRNRRQFLRTTGAGLASGLILPSGGMLSAGRSLEAQDPVLGHPNRPPASPSSTPAAACPSA